MKHRRPPAPTAGQLACAALRRSARQILRRDPAVRLDQDPEDLHQFRVAVRKLRSDLQVFAPVLDAGSVSSLRAELRWLNGDVGGARDADVLLERLRTRLPRLPEPDRPRAGTLLGLLEDQRAERHRALMAALSSARYDALASILAREAEAPERSLGGPGVAGEPAASLHLVRRPWRRLASACEALGDAPSDAALHEVRILARRCRYTAEATVAVSGRAAERFAEVITGLQDLLGAHHDAVVAEEWLRAAAVTVPDAGMPAGELVLLEHQEQDHLRAAWPAAWAAASKPRLRDWI